MQSKLVLTCRLPFNEHDSFSSSSIIPINAIKLNFNRLMLEEDRFSRHVGKFGKEFALPELLKAEWFNASGDLNSLAKRNYLAN